MLTNGKYNNAFLIISSALLFVLFAPVYAVLFSFPASILFAVVASCDCFCFILDMRTAGLVAILLMPFRLLQMLIVVVLVALFNLLFWSLMIIPAYILCFAWGARMIYFWTFQHKVVRTPKVQKRRISKLYDKAALQNISDNNKMGTQLKPPAKHAAHIEL